MHIIDLLTNNQWYLFYIMAIMFAAGYVKDTGLFLPVYNWLIDNIKSKRAVVTLISMVSGVLPIPGRVTVSAGFLDTIAPKKKGREKYGIIDYLATHHYYWWSPLEKTVILPMAVLGLSYGGFISIVWPIILAYAAVLIYYIFFYLQESDVDVKISKSKCEHDKVGWKNWIDWKVIGWVAAVIVLGNYLKTYSGDVTAYLEGSSTVVIAMIASFFFSFMLGSSGKYAGFVALMAGAFGIQYLPLLLVIDYAGYMLSPVHKCFVVGKTYFNTPLKDYYYAIGLLLVALFAAAIGVYLL